MDSITAFDPISVSANFSFNVTAICGSIQCLNPGFVFVPTGISDAIVVFHAKSGTVDA